MGKFHTISPIRGWFFPKHTQRPAASLLQRNKDAFSTHNFILNYGLRPWPKRYGEGFFTHSQSYYDILDSQRDLFFKLLRKRYHD